VPRLSRVSRVLRFIFVPLKIQPLVKLQVTAFSNFNEKMLWHQLCFYIRLLTRNVKSQKTWLVPDNF
jgi:hypothetical protein